MRLIERLLDWWAMRRKDREGNGEKQERKVLDHILHELREIKRFLETAKEIQILQISGGFPMPITGVAVGGTGTFQEKGLPAGSVFPTGTTFVWSSSDTANTSLTPSTDGTQVAMAVGAGATVGGSTTLSCVATLPSGAGTVSGSVSVPYLAGKPVVPTSIEIDQLS